MSKVIRSVLDKALPRLKRILPRTPAGDRLYHQVLFYRKHGRLPNGALLWNDMWFRVKTSDEIDDPLRVYVSDKEHVKQYVKAVVGDEFNVPTHAVLRSPTEVDSFDFPPQCCIKPTHASARLILRRDGEPVDRERIKRWFSINYYDVGRERNYRHLRPKVIVEPLIFGSTNVEDFKVFCFNGEPRIIQVDVDRHANHTRKYFDTGWNELDFSIIYPRAPGPIPRPANLGVMLDVARKLSAQFSFVRIDLYSDNRQLMVGEITNCSENAGGFFVPGRAEQEVSKLMFG
jgi:hypothetical protein